MVERKTGDGGVAVLPAEQYAIAHENICHVGRNDNGAARTHGDSVCLVQHAGPRAKQGSPSAKYLTLPTIEPWVHVGEDLEPIDVFSQGIKIGYDFCRLT